MTAPPSFLFFHFIHFNVHDGLAQKEKKDLSLMRSLILVGHLVK